MVKAALIALVVKVSYHETTTVGMFCSRENSIIRRKETTIIDEKILVKERRPTIILNNNTMREHLNPCQMM